MASSLPIPSEAIPLVTQPAPAGGDIQPWEARLFGAFRLIAPDGNDATPTRRKARALVAYLLAATDDGTTRERLAALLWSERGGDQARASLRQTFYELRTLSSGAAPPIVVDRSRVVLVHARIATDVARLDDAARVDDATVLAALVGDRPAEFLADLDGIDPAFDDWLSIERTRRRDARRRALLAVADRKLAADDPEAARHLADCLLACDPADEAAALIAMRASHRRGDRDAVRRYFATLTGSLQRLVGERPSAETDEAYRRMMASPRSATPSPSAIAAEGPAPSEQPGKEVLLVDCIAPAEGALVEEPDVALSRVPAAHRRRRWTLLAAVIAVLTVAAVESIGWRNAGGAAMQRLLLVEPMQVAPDDPAAAALRNGFSAELARVLVGRPDFVVREAGHASDDALDRTFAIATDTRSQDGVLHVGLRLLGRKDDAILWSTTFARPAGDVAALREQMAAKVADVATCALDGRHVDLRDFRSDTLQLLLGACDVRHTDPLEAAKLLEQLTRQMPRFAHGWALLAMTSAGAEDPVPADADGTTSRADSPAGRALALDRHDGDAYVGRAAALLGIARWPQRMAIVREGLAMDPDNADLAIALAHGFAQLGYVQQAIAWSERAVHADPFDPVKATDHAKFLDMAWPLLGPQTTTAFGNARRRFGADYDLALAEFRYQALVGDHRRAAEMLADPNRGFDFHPDRAVLWRALIATRADPSPARDADARRAFAAGLHAIPDINPWTIETLSFLHRVDEAYAHADRMAPRPLDEDVTDSLFGGANRALRADPRFMTLAARLGLAAIWRSTGEWPDFCSEPDLGYDCRVEAERALSADPRPLVTTQ